uniref:Uncharacterized protein n=1 Tax=viral metagenome TaxID=1070528 RepID=A0A2V0RLX3_9ZZZZ
MEPSELHSISEALFIFSKEVKLYQGISYEKEGNASLMLTCLEKGVIKGCNKDSINFLFAIIAVTGDETFEVRDFGPVQDLGNDIKVLVIKGDYTSSYNRDIISTTYLMNRDNSGTLNSLVGSHFQKYAVPINWRIKDINWNRSFKEANVFVMRQIICDFEDFAHARSSIVRYCDFNGN